MKKLLSWVMTLGEIVMWKVVIGEFPIQNDVTTADCGNRDYIIYTLKEEWKPMDSTYW